MRTSILFIEGTAGFIPKAMIKKLREFGFDVICVPDVLAEVALHRNEADILIYYLPGSISQIEQTMQYLSELCETEHKTLSIAGEPANVAKVKDMAAEGLIYASYPRPVNIDNMVLDMFMLSSSREEYNRMKTILIIDDDPDFLLIMEHWLRFTYMVDTVRSGREALHYLESKHPDLVLLDYEMPELDGYQVLDKMRRNPLTAQIPIIFLTGKNDRDSVMRIIKRKPDGYLLKSMSKEELLESLDKFFENSIINNPKNTQNPFNI